MWIAWLPAPHGKKLNSSACFITKNKKRPFKQRQEGMHRQPILKSQSSLLNKIGPLEKIKSTNMIHQVYRGSRTRYSLPQRRVSYLPLWLQGYLWTGYADRPHVVA